MEVSAALANAACVGLATREAVEAGLADLDADWSDLIRPDVTEATVARAAALASSQGLRGYGAVQLARAR